MTHIEQMIKDMCPHGVEFKKLGDICDIRGRIGFRGYTREDQVSKGEGAISLSPANIKGSKIFYDDCTYITWDKYEESPEIMVENGDVIFCKTASVGKTAYIDYLPEKATINPQLVLLKNIKCDSKFLSYYLQTPNIQDSVKQVLGVGSVPNVSQAKLSELSIPVPPIEIQQRIVAILDAFSALAAELQAELQMRRKQYEYYRTQLLTPHSESNSADKSDDCNWEWKNLVDIAVVQYGYPFEAEKFTDDDSYIPLIRIRDVVPAQASTYYEGEYPKEYIVKKGDILVGMDGNFNLEKWNDRDGLLNQRVCKIYSKDNNIVLNDFLYHYLRPEFKSIENEIKGGTVKHLSAARIKKIVVPVPSIKEQKRIAEALNLFTKIIQDMEEGIPAEQIRQQKRYEYYRDLLLTFDRKAV